MALFLFVPALIITLASSVIFSHRLLFLAVVLFTLLIALTGHRQLRWSKLAIAVSFFVINILISIFIFSPVYSPTALYYIYFFIAGFLISSTLQEHYLRHFIKVTIGIYLFLACWALVQFYTGDLYLAGRRPNSIFTTPNTFAAAINLVLLPLISFYCFHKSGKFLFFILMLLTAALMVSFSRGGYVSFIIGFIIISVLAYSGFTADSWLKWKKIAAGLLILIILIPLGGLIKITNYTINLQSNLSGENTVKPIKQKLNVKKEILGPSSITDRIHYYEIATDLIKEQSLYGRGFLNYMYYYQRDKPEYYYGVSRYGAFTHNDYLQIWAETGLLGILSLLLIILFFYHKCLTLITSAEEKYETKVTAIALTSALTAYFAHAMVDFVMYPPILLLFFGAYVGYINRIGLVNHKAPNKLPNITVVSRYIRPRLLKLLGSLLIIGWLSQPAVAEYFWESANKHSQMGQYDKALDKLTTAIKFAPYSSDLYFQAGRIMYTSAINTSNKEHAEEADALFQQGANISIYDYHNRYARALLHRDRPELLDDPASKEEILDWFSHALYWRPQQESIIIEYIKTLVKYDMLALAQKEVSTSLTYYPDSDELLAIEKEIQISH